ncbi:hypothetical protein FP803_00320 [Candidatus Woesearchaeota archaeon]|nr:hypothetical protein [Candidatus Woesearchaeota archaeon]
MAYTIIQQEGYLSLRHSAISPEKMYKDFFDFVYAKLPEKITKSKKYIEGPEAIYFVISKGRWESRYSKEKERFSIMVVRKALSAPNYLRLDDILKQYADKLKTENKK